jgi:hypothetical protein
MRVIVAGSRTYEDFPAISRAIEDSGFRITQLVSGACRTGVDALAEHWASYRNISIKRFPADWDTHGRAAGPIRNAEMAAYAEALIAIWDGRSRGTKNMIDEARKRRLPIFVRLVE